MDKKKGIKEWRAEKPIFPIENKKGINHLAYNTPIDDLTLKQVEEEIEIYIKAFKHEWNRKSGDKEVLEESDVLESLKLIVKNNLNGLSVPFYYLDKLGTLLLLKQVWKKEITILS